MRNIKYAVLILLAAAVYARAEAAGAGLQDLLSYDLAELMNVEVISASKEKEAASQASATVRVITAEQIKERGYLTLEEALAGLPGFQFREISGFNGYVFMRGLPSQNNLILLLVDGVQINELNSGGFYAGAQHNLANVKRIEVVYGPASALYGTNAVSGVVNLITRDPADIGGGSAGALAGGFGTRGTDFSYGFRDDAAGYGVSFSGAMKRTDKHALRGAAGDNNWSQNMENFEEDWSFDGKLEYKDFTFGAVVQDKRASRSTNDKSAGTAYLDFGTNWHIRFANAWLKHSYAAESGWTLDSRLYYRASTVLDDTVSSVYNLVCSTCGQQGQYRPNDLFGLESQLSLKPAEGLELTGGAAAERENLARDFSTTYSGDPLARPPAPGSPAMASNELLSLYAQARYDIAQGLRFTGGLRHDNSSSYGKVYTPRAGLVYNREQLTLKLLYGEAFRAPKPWDRTYGAGNPGLHPEEMTSAELSGAYAFNGNLRADLALYRNKLDNILELDGAANRYVNSGDIETRGLEAQLEYARGPLKGRLSYTCQVSEDDAGEDIEEIARHGAGAGLFYAFGRQLKLDVEGRWSGRRKNTRTIAATGSDYVGAAFVADAALSFLNSRNLTASLIGKNIFNSRYYHTSNRPPDRYRQPARQLLLQFGYAFGFH
ncbi:MAG TPA: hypothetical protein DEQ38_07325 [Elusimicrobia bacterium]|nr:MAG: hypothetical protein A2089_08185 [Elusimicrobia bacterium GWD2_63_28]HCC47908.1 hypothetical protein [Elusimicrobiota bacterium]